MSTCATPTWTYEEQGAVAVDARMLSSDERHARRLANLRAANGHGVALLAHPHFGGASIGLSARASRAVGACRPIPFSKTVHSSTRSCRAGLPIARPDNVRVTTSARPRALGLAGLLAQA